LKCNTGLLATAVKEGSANEDSDSDLDEQTFASVANKNKERWSVAGQRGRRSAGTTGFQSRGPVDKKIKLATVIYGNKVVVDTTKLLAVKEERVWHCKLSRLRDGMTAGDVRDYMVEQGVIPVDIEELPQRIGVALSVHIQVPYDAREAVMNAGFWTKGLRISGWHFARKQHRIQN
jgi:hypothetical protein